MLNIADTLSGLIAYTVIEKENWCFLLLFLLFDDDDNDDDDDYHYF